MPWLQIRVPTLPEHTDFIEDALLIAGCQAVTLIDTNDVPVFEPIRGTTPLWEHTTVQGLFESDVDAAELVRQVSDAANAKGITLSQITTDMLEDKDWEREWMSNFAPIACGDRLWIVPSWLEPPNKNAVNLKLDPGLAFGTGTHPTTFLCLKWLNDNVQKNDRILDYGCGSGILGLAALLLGAKHMDGIDIDPQAITATENNAKTNDIADDCFRVSTKPETLDHAYEIVVANILAGPLCELAHDIAKRVQLGGKLALSGILVHQMNEVISAYSPYIDFNEPNIQDDWVCLSGFRVNKL